MAATVSSSIVMTGSDLQMRYSLYVITKRVIKSTLGVNLFFTLMWVVPTLGAYPLQLVFSISGFRNKAGL